MGSRIVATGRAVPRTALTNSDLERYMDTSDEWIRSRTGIGQRYLMRQGESLAQIATDASPMRMMIGSGTPSRKSNTERIVPPFFDSQCNIRDQCGASA